MILIKSPPKDNIKNDLNSITAESDHLVALDTFCELFVKKCCPILTILLSGSPIIQDGKLVGAVIHVLINDPTTGYGIFIENMLNQMGDLAK